MNQENEIKNIDRLFVDLQSKDNKTRFDAFQTLLQITENKIEWVYDKWFDLIEKLNSENSFQRSIGLM